MPIAVSLTAMIFMMAALAAPWYGVYSKGSDHDTKSEFSFWDMRTESNSHGTTYIQVETWTKYTDDYKESHDKDPRLPVLYQAVEIFVILGMVMSILAFVSLVLTWFGKGPAMLVNYTGRFLVAAAAIGLVCIIIFAGAHPWAINEDSLSSTDWGPGKSIIGTHSESGLDYTWTVTTGWILALAASIMMLAAFLMLKKRSRNAPAASDDHIAQPAHDASGFYQTQAPPQQPVDYPPEQ
jgi:cytochrome bd-type quinol oxidase subunit 1